MTTFEDDDDLLEEQEGTGYGEDEGEREGALDDLDDGDVDDTADE